MSEAILVGFIGVLGVLVGGLITGGFSYLLYRKEAQRADAKERKDELYATQDALYEAARRHQDYIYALRYRSIDTEAAREAHFRTINQLLVLGQRVDDDVFRDLIKEYSPACGRIITNLHQQDYTNFEALQARAVDLQQKISHRLVELARAA